MANVDCCALFRLLALSPSKRLSARAALAHAWLTPDQATVELSK